MSGRNSIDGYAIIADGETGALIGRDATIEWLCFPRFDSEACFASLLGTRDNGCWALAPVTPVLKQSRRYRDNTLILETDMETRTGKVRIIDFMPIRGEAPDIVRIVEGIAGEVEMASELILRFDYGRLHPLVELQDQCNALAVAGPDGVALSFDAGIEFADRRLSSRFTAREGSRTTFVLTWYASHLPPPRHVVPEQSLADTEQEWKSWTNRIDYRGSHRDAVIRSLITLKALVHRPTGGMVAALTTSIPERPEGSRNWDYRYCWLRDATFTLLAFTHFGLHKEARDWIAWLERAICGDPIEMQPFFGIDGYRRLPEWEVEWLPGFNQARPVRIGNGAAHQLQLDVFGQVIDALFQAFSTEKICAPQPGDDLITRLADKLEEVWEKPDAGIWESRGRPAHHTYSKVMCWVGFDRAAAWHDDHDKERAAHFRQLAARVYDMVMAEGFDAGRNTFVAEFGHTRLDAALLRLPLVGFIEARDPRMIGTVAAIEEELLCNDGLVRRYLPEETDDGVGGQEGAFVAACFWLSEIYHLQGRRADADALFEQTLACANDLGLLAEELSIEGEPRQLGNFPQGLSHLALIMAAQQLCEPEHPARERKARSQDAA
ncbi:glucoamylase [Novosphingobium endophyticum]|uniref:Glucoamylase n=1 Tax=Novosphingobium endophyticum TaxID=1955250 RepID=A0A916X525_9SPHN|nr:glycoside hydrolase family 15 protein [Novosphingobium endophyticum]GGC05178.1 glucoamylase [Novosphingobium endophyticum]